MTNREKSDELYNLIQNINNAINELSEDFQEYKDKLEDLRDSVIDEQETYEKLADDEEYAEAVMELQEREREYRSIQGF